MAETMTASIALSGTDNSCPSMPTALARLATIAQELREDKAPTPTTVRQFLSWFGFSRRGPGVARHVRDALKAAGLVTEPDFESAYIDAPMKFVHVTNGNGAPNGSKPVAQPMTSPEGNGTAGTAPVSSAFSDPTYRIGKLTAANHKPVSVRPDQPLEAAVTLMLTHDFSQLPVMTSERTVHGVISWRSIGARWALDSDGTIVRQFMDRAPEIDADQSLFGAIPTIIDCGFILVRDSTKRIVGIVTATDLSKQFQQLAEPFLLVGEIENHVRRLIDGKFTKEELEKLGGASGPRPIDRVADLTFGHYVRLLEDPQRWSRVARHIDRATFTSQLDEVRKIRNDIVHFDPDPLEPERLETLRRFSRFLQTLHALGL